MRDDADLTPGMAESDMTGDATEQVTGTESTASPMGSSGLSGAGGGAFASSADVHGSVESAAGAVTANGRRLRLRYPPAPGGNSSPQAPGATPDFSTIPGERVDRSPKVDAVRHPAVQAGTAEGIMGFHDAAPGEESDPERFELGLTSFRGAAQGTAVAPDTGPAGPLGLRARRAGLAASGDRGRGVRPSRGPVVIDVSGSSGLTGRCGAAGWRDRRQSDAR